MAVDGQTTALSNIDSDVVNDSALQGKAKLCVTKFNYEKLATNTDGDKIQLCQLHSDWVVLSIVTNNDALTGCTDVDVGLYENKAPAGAAAKDADVYADGISFATADKNTERAFSAKDIANIDKQVWEDAGDSVKPVDDKWYRLCLTLNTGGTATGTISGYVVYAEPA